MPDKKEKKLKTLLGSHYFVYFGTLGVFLPYFNLFCRHLGFSGVEIGLISSVKTAAVVIFPILWAMAADRFNARRAILIGCSAMSVLLWLPLFYTGTFLPVFVLIACQSLFYAPIVSFLEAFAMEILGKEKRAYGRSRVWGSIAFIVVSMGLGRVLTDRPIEIIIPLILVGMSLQVILSLKLPSTQTQPETETATDPKTQPDPRLETQPDLQSKTKIESEPYFRTHLKIFAFQDFFSKNTNLFLVAAFLMLVSHGAYYGFFSIYLESLGFTTGFIGFSWGLASIAEIGVMIASASIFSKFNLKHVLCFSFMAAAIRWLSLFATGIAPHGSMFASGGFILLTQLLHAFTYGTFHIASILAVDSLSQKSGSTFGQAVNNAVSYGAGMMAGFMLSGIYYDRMQEWLFLASAMCALAGIGVLLFVSFVSEPSQ